MAKIQLRKKLSQFDLSRRFSEHLIGEDHTLGHRRMFGVSIMIFGVGMVKTSAMIDSVLVHFLGDIFGYAIHGVGCIPFFQSLEEKMSKKDKDLNNKNDENEK